MITGFAFYALHMHIIVPVHYVAKIEIEPFPPSGPPTFKTWLRLCNTLVCRLRIFVGPLYTIYRVSSYLQLLALSIVTGSPNMSFLQFLVPLVTDNSSSLKKNELGHSPPSPQPAVRKNSKFLLIATCALDLTFLVPLTLENKRFPQIGGQNPYQGSPYGSRVIPLDSTGMISYQPLIVPEAVYCTVFQIQPSTHVQRPYIWNLAIPLAFNPRQRDFPRTISIKLCRDGQGTKWHKDIVENFNRLSRVQAKMRNNANICKRLMLATKVMESRLHEHTRGQLD